MTMHEYPKGRAVFRLAPHRIAITSVLIGKALGTPWVRFLARGCLGARSRLSRIGGLGMDGFEPALDYVPESLGPRNLIRRSPVIDTGNYLRRQTHCDSRIHAGSRASWPSFNFFVCENC